MHIYKTPYSNIFEEHNFVVLMDLNNCEVCAGGIFFYHVRTCMHTRFMSFRKMFSEPDVRKFGAIPRYVC